jgi:2-octaprenyl-6-methoxyphenol hydroxylase
MLLGEAAHLIPPIGAQGLNISLRDAAMAAELVIDALAAGKDPGSHEVIRTYADSRQPDVSLRQTVVHNFNRSLLADFLPFTLARTAGLALMSQLGPLRRSVMREGLAPSVHLPRAMRAQT